MPKLSILTLNAAIQDLRLLGRPVYRPVPHTRERLAALPGALTAVGADIVCLQELFHPHLQRQLHRHLRSVYPYASGFARPGPSLRLHSEFIVMSRYPLGADRLHRFRAAPREELLFTSKGYQEFSVAVPGLGAIDVLNVHATAGGLRAHPQSPPMERIRARQIRQILDHGHRDRPVILAGDLNAGPHSSTGIYKLVIDAGFTDAFARGGGDGITWDPANPLVAGGRESHLPAQRIDHVFLSQALAGRIEPISAAIVLKSRSVETGTLRVPLSDHYGVLTVFEYEVR
ncbi:MAG: endonuclease/exonuclease/phosphatase family protein [Gammaproteobacteria bacterium]|nr:endonuclease/exonuclease/phosphatase family protein [Gammaproteobacteria bacterium]